MSKEKEFKDIKDILSHQSQVKAPSDMSQRVLAVWKSEHSALKPSTPLIPGWFFKLIGLILAALFVGSMLSTTRNVFTIPSISRYLHLPNLNFDLPTLELGVPIYASVSCLVLVLVLQMIYLFTVNPISCNRNNLLHDDD